MSSWDKIATCARNSKKARGKKKKTVKKIAPVPHFRSQMLNYLHSCGISLGDASAPNAFLIKMCNDQLGTNYAPDSIGDIKSLMALLPELPKRVRRRKPPTDFYRSQAWLALRFQVLRENDGRCELCGSGKHDGVKLHVDHIKPRSKFPKLALERTNLQILCEPCNLGKSNRDDTDWRESNVVAMRPDEWAEIRARMGEG